MKKYTYLILIFVAVGIAASVLFAGPAMEAGAQQADPDTAQEPYPDIWPDEPGVMPPLVGGKKADRPLVFIEPDTNTESRQSVESLTLVLWDGNSQSFGQIGNPQQWVNILGNVSSTRGYKSINLTYSLNGSADMPLTVGLKDSGNPRLVNDGDFNIEIDYNDLVSGANTVKITAEESVIGGEKQEYNVTVNYTPNKVWPENYTANWGAAAKIQDIAQIVDGNWDITAAGKVKLKDAKKDIGYDRLIAIGEMDDKVNSPKTWTEYEVTVPIKVNGLDSDPKAFEPPSNGPGVGIILRWQGHNQGDPPKQPRVGVENLGTLGWYHWDNNSEGLQLVETSKSLNSTASLNSTTSEKVWEFPVEYMMKMSVQQATSGDLTRAYYRLKLWKAGTKEPLLWDLEGYSNPGNMPSGSVVLVAHHVDAEFGNVKVEPVKDLIFTLNTDANPTDRGQVVVSSHPGQSEFEYGTTVRVLALPNTGNLLDSWSGDINEPGWDIENGTNNNPIVFNMTSDAEVVANFIEAQPGKPIITVEGAGTVSESADVSPDPTTGKYPGGQPVTLTAVPKQGSIFVGWSGEYNGTKNPITIRIAGDKQIKATFKNLGEASPISDDFNQCELDTNLWTFVNPTGNGSLKATGTTLQINVPAGSAHSMWPTINNDAPRVMQTTKNQDFTIDIKFNTVPKAKTQIEGLLVQQDANSYLRFDIYNDGTAVKMFAGAIINGVKQGTSINKVSGAISDAIYMRVSRVGDVWTQSYSTDGMTWQGAHGISQAVTVQSTGIYAANEPDGSAPAWMVEAEYFLNTAFPIGNTGYILSTNVVGNGTIQLSPQPDVNGSYGCNQEVELKAVPTGAQKFTGWSGALSGTTNPAKLTMNANKSVTAYFGSEPVKGACTQIGSSQNGVCMPVVLNKYSQ